MILDRSNGGRYTFNAYAECPDFGYYESLGDTPQSIAARITDYLTRGGFLTVESCTVEVTENVIAHDVLCAVLHVTVIDRQVDTADIDTLVIAACQNGHAVDSFAERYARWAAHRPGLASAFTPPGTPARTGGAVAVTAVAHGDVRRTPAASASVALGRPTSALNSVRSSDPARDGSVRIANSASDARNWVGDALGPLATPALVIAGVAIGIGVLVGASYILKRVK